MHRIYVSEGIVLGKRNVGEANTLVSVLTREHGLLRAKATATRVEKSKLRFGLEPLTRARFSFVEGRHEWKLVGVEDVLSIAHSTRSDARTALGRITKLLVRLVQGQEKVPGLFEHVEAGLISIAGAKGSAELRNIECVLVLRILSDLGYLPSSNELAPFLKGSEFSAEITEEAAKARSYLIRMINESLAESGL